MFLKQILHKYLQDGFAAQCISQVFNIDSGLLGQKSTQDRKLHFLTNTINSKL